MVRYTNVLHCIDTGRVSAIECDAMQRDGLCVMSYTSWGIIVPPLMGVLYYHTFLAITQDECVAKRHNNRHLDMFGLECFTICHIPKPI